MDKYNIDLKEIKKVENRGVVGAAFLSLGIFAMGVLLVSKFSFFFSGFTAMIVSVLLFRAFRKESIKRINVWIKVNEILKNDEH